MKNTYTITTQSISNASISLISVRKIDVALIRGTTSDLEGKLGVFSELIGNISMEKEALTLDSLNMAIASNSSWIL